MLDEHLTQDVLKVLKTYQLISFKPMLIALNAGTILKNGIYYLRTYPLLALIALVAIITDIFMAIIQMGSFNVGNSLFQYCHIGNNKFSFKSINIS